MLSHHGQQSTEKLCQHIIFGLQFCIKGHEAIKMMMSKLKREHGVKAQGQSPPDCVSSRQRGQVQ